MLAMPLQWLVQSGAFSIGYFFANCANTSLVAEGALMIG